MKRVLLTGMSGTGKSSVIEELRQRGFSAIDMDEPGWSEHDSDGHQQWRESRVQEALDSAGHEVLFLSGCAENQVKFYPQLTDIILLSAPAKVLTERLRTRPTVPMASDLRNLQKCSTILKRSSRYFDVEPHTRSQRPFLSFRLSKRF